MVGLWVAFITGLTTGGLSCMAVQGGLIASSLAHQIEKDVLSRSRRLTFKNQFHIALPILLFLSSKIIAYTLAGLLLGAVGSLFELTPLTRALLQFAIALFMIGNGLRMLEVHPAFRFFSFEPPSSLTRFIRKLSKNNDTWFTPAFLGFLTILIPCGVTQTMMAAAIATGDPLNGAALMFAFTLGTSPVFFILVFFAAKLGSMLEKYFVRAIAVVLIILGLLAVDTGLNLLGAPVSVTRLLQKATVVQTEQIVATVPSSEKSDHSILNLSVVNSGYEPTTLHAPADEVITLNLITDETRSCSRAFVIPELGLNKLLPETGVESLTIPPQTSGKVIGFTCSMGMYTGNIIFE